MAIGDIAVIVEIKHMMLIQIIPYALFHAAIFKHMVALFISQKTRLISIGSLIRRVFRWEEKLSLDI